MNFNVYVKKDVGEKITKMAEVLHRSRNSIVAEALDEWIKHHTPSQWPKHFFDFETIQDLPDFKNLRKGLINNISEDPLA